MQYDFCCCLLFTKSTRTTRKKEQPFDPKMYREKFKDYIEALGDVLVLTPHSCRHTYVSQMQALDVDLATIQSMVGHADLDMTQHYLHV